MAPDQDAPAAAPATPEDQTGVPPATSPAAAVEPPARSAPPPGFYFADLSAAPAPVPVTATEIADRGKLAERLAQESDALPHGPEVRVALIRAAESAGNLDTEAQAVADEWAGTFAAHGISARDAVELTGIGAGVQRDGIPDEATEERWLREIPERLRFEFGSAEAAERAAELARAWVGRDARLREYLERTRLGSHPRVVLAIAKAAYQAHTTGKWRPK